MSGIGNRAIMRALGKVFGIEDVKQAPQDFDTSTVKVVAGLDPGMMAVEQHQLYEYAVNVAGAAVVTWLPFGTAGGGTFNATTARLLNNALDCVVLGMRIGIDYDAAGRDADAAAGRYLTLNIGRMKAGGSISYNFESFEQVIALINPGTLNYIWGHPWHQTQDAYGGDPPVPIGGRRLAMNPIYVPAGSELYVSIGRSAGAFPANTTAYANAFVVSCPKGFRPPCM